MVALLETRQRITKLTLALLKDTNFYAEVDDSLTDEVFYGSGRGCKFARGDPSEFTNECVTSSTSSTSNCDFYNEHFFYCNKT